MFSRSSMFVTVFYAILEPTTGKLTFCNAGHNPPFLLHDHAKPLPLPTSGVPLGVLDDATWRAETVMLAPGDVLVLYTDGVNEAQNGNEEFFEVARLLDAARSDCNPTAEAVQTVILTAVDQFVGDAPQSDDSTIMVLVRGLGKVERRCIIEQAADTVSAARSNRGIVLACMMLSYAVCWLPLFDKLRACLPTVDCHYEPPGPG